MPRYDIKGCVGARAVRIAAERGASEALPPLQRAEPSTRRFEPAPYPVPQKLTRATHLTECCRAPTPPAGPFAGPAAETDR